MSLVLFYTPVLRNNVNLHGNTSMLHFLGIHIIWIANADEGQISVPPLVIMFLQICTALLTCRIHTQIRSAKHVLVTGPNHCLTRVLHCPALRLMSPYFYAGQTILLVQKQAVSPTLTATIFSSKDRYYQNFNLDDIRDTSNISQMTRLLILQQYILAMG